MKSPLVNIRQTALAIIVGAMPAVLGAQSLPVTDGLVLYYLANDLSTRSVADSEVVVWEPNQGSGSLTVPSGFAAPKFVPKGGSDAMDSAAVRFAQPQTKEGLLRYEDYPFTPVLQFPEIMTATDEPWRELTVLIACNDYQGALLTTDAPAVGWYSFLIDTTVLQFLDVTNMAEVRFHESSLPLFESGVIAATIGRDSSDLATLSVFVNGEPAEAPVTQFKRVEADEMLPFTGVRWYRAPDGELTESEDGTKNYPRMSALGLNGSKGLNADIYAVVVYNRALSADEIEKVSNYLVENLGLD